MWTSAYIVISSSLCVLPTDQGLAAAPNCNKSRLGLSYCIEFEGDIGYQYGTCLTNAYIRQKSKGSHICEGHTEVCTRQCMLETYDEIDVTVRGVCSCNPSSPIVQSSQLPPACFSPDGSACGWYTNCLEQRILCGGESGYAVAFAQKFCELYDTNKFSTVARVWMDEVRKCLQVALVPLLRLYAQPTCDSLKQTAFDSHTPCYLRPYRGALPICALPIKDLVKILMTVKGAVVQETYKTLSNAFKVGSGCTKNLLLESYQRVFDVVITKHRGGNRKRRRKRSASEMEIILASQFLQAMADRFKWNDANIDFLLVAIDKEDDTIRFKFILSDRTASDDIKNAGNNTRFSNEIIKVQLAIQDGDVAFRVGDNNPYYVSNLSECVDAKCNSVSYTIIGKLKLEANSIVSNNVIMVCMAGLVFVVVVIIAGVVVVGWATSTAVSAVVAYKVQ